MKTLEIERVFVEGEFLGKARSARAEAVQGTRLTGGEN